MNVRICIVPDCENRQRRVDGYCGKHIWRLDNTGSLEPGKKSPERTPLSRFLEDITLGDDCWEWRGYKDRSGYGCMGLGPGRRGVRDRTTRVHRFAYELLVGPIPEGLVIDHLCRNRACSRPDHLEAVTQSENAARAAEAQYGRRGGDPTCHRGHDMTDEANVYRPKNGYAPTCRKCQALRARLKYHSQKAAAAASTEAVA